MQYIWVIVFCSLVHAVDEEEMKRLNAAMRGIDQQLGDISHLNEDEFPEQMEQLLKMDPKKLQRELYDAIDDDELAENAPQIFKENKEKMVPLAHQLRDLIKNRKEVEKLRKEALKKEKSNPARKDPREMSKDEIYKTIGLKVDANGKLVDDEVFKNAPRLQNGVIIDEL